MKNIILIIIVVLLLGAIGFVYWYRFQFQETVTLPEAPTNTALQLIGRLERIKIDTSFFQDERFTGLQVVDIPPIDQLEQGRENPFIAASLAPKGSGVLPKKQPNTSPSDVAEEEEPPFFE